MSTLLAEIIKNKRAEVAHARAAQPPETLREVITPSERDFRAALAGGRDGIPRLIAEIKRKSPSEQSIRADLDVEEIMQTYNEHAAAASILTDQKYFGGSLEDLDAADHATKIPLLRKDFIVDEYQLFEARQFGADAVLLIAAILDDQQLTELLATAKEIGISALVEVHTSDELERVLKTSAEIIGINSRNLETLAVDHAIVSELARQIPEDKIIVAESGLATAEDIDALRGKVDAVLVGTHILRAENIETKLLELTHPPALEN